MLRQPPRSPPPLYELVGYRQPRSALLPQQTRGRPECAPEQPHRAGGATTKGCCGGHPATATATGDPKSEQQQLRRKINSRERKRMQDLNVAMDALREAILPYSAAHCQSSPGRKLSKIATLLLARNYILLLGSSLQELRRIVGEMSGTAGPRLLLAAGLPLFAAGPGPVLLTPAGNVSHHHHHHHPPPDSLRPGAGKFLSVALEEQACGPAAPTPGTAGLCTCALCKFPHLVPSGFGLAAVQAHFSK